MKKTILAWRDVPQLAKTDAAYATGDSQLKPFYQNSPSRAGFEATIAAKQHAPDHRTQVIAALKKQYAAFDAESAIDSNAAFQFSNWYTVTTAHQPTLFAGPLYFVLKAVTTIRLAQQLSAWFPSETFVPFFVLGSEDHDLEELNHATVYGKKLIWATEQTGSVGAMTTDDLSLVLQELATVLGEGETAKSIYATIEKAYTEQKTFADATQCLLHQLLGVHGLVVLNMDDVDLKRLFIPFFQKELFEQTSERIVSATIEKLNAAGFKTQAAPRPINLFYRSEQDGKGRRDRIVFENGRFEAIGTDLFWDYDQMQKALETSPERFSPNVVMRPLFQEYILPNLAYIGGGGELAYWLERLDQFAAFGIAFPILIRRNSLVWADGDAQKKLARLGFSIVEFFADAEALSKRYVDRHLAVEVSLSDETNELRNIFQKLMAKAKAIDATLEASVGAEATKQIAAFENWENKLRRAEKQKHDVALGQLKTLKEKLFPSGGLHERSDSWLPFYLKTDGKFFELLLEELNPFDEGVVVLETT